jgi:hypothetical protein
MSSILSKKNSNFFAKFFGEKFFLIKTSVPDLTTLKKIPRPKQTLTCKSLMEQVESRCHHCMYYLLFSRFWGIWLSDPKCGGPEESAQDGRGGRDGQAGRRGQKARRSGEQGAAATRPNLPNPFDLYTSK